MSELNGLTDSKCLTKPNSETVKFREVIVNYLYLSPFADTLPVSSTCDEFKYEIDEWYEENLFEVSMPYFPDIDLDSDLATTNISNLNVDVNQSVKNQDSELKALTVNEGSAQYYKNTKNEITMRISLKSTGSQTKSVKTKSIKCGTYTPELIFNCTNHSKIRNCSVN